MTRKLLKRIWLLPALSRHLWAGIAHFDRGDYAGALTHYAKCEQIMLSVAKPLTPTLMLEKALCHQVLEQDDDAVAYLQLLWESIRDSKKFNADEKAYLFLYVGKRAEPYQLATKAIPPGYERFWLENVRKKVRSRYPIPEVEELESVRSVTK